MVEPLKGKFNVNSIFGHPSSSPFFGHLSEAKQIFLPDLSFLLRQDRAIPLQFSEQSRLFRIDDEVFCVSSENSMVQLKNLVLSRLLEVLFVVQIRQEDGLGQIGI